MGTDRIAVVTASYGGFDRVRAQAAQDFAADWYAFTDDPRADVPAPWTAIVRKPPTEGAHHPRVTARWHKMHPHLAVTGYDRVIWLDANMEVTTSGFIGGVLASMHDGIAVWKHPHRDCIYDEARVCDTLPKYRGLPQLAQVSEYKNEGFPRHGGLYALGTIGWDVTDPHVRELAEQWWDEAQRWHAGGRPTIDQLSFPVVCRRNGAQPGTFPISQIERAPRVQPPTPYLSNRWLRIWPHELADQ